LEGQGAIFLAGHPSRLTGLQPVVRGEDLQPFRSPPPLTGTPQLQGNVVYINPVVPRKSLGCAAQQRGGGWSADNRSPNQSAAARQRSSVGEGV